MSLAEGFQGRVRFTERFEPRPHVSHVIFDFDGTLSLIRQGWPDVMVPLFDELLPRIEGETDASVREMLFDDIMRLNGKQTIYQMIQFADSVRERGGPELDPLELKHEYLRRLQERIAERISGLEDGSIPRDELTLFGAHALLEQLQQRDLQMYLLSGTDEPFVKREAELLDVARFFGDNIHGAQDDYHSFSKQMIMQRLLDEQQMTGEQLLVFGDGYVEVELGSQLGGLSVALASDEANNGSGSFDAWKLDRLLGVGAGVVIPDYRDAGVLLERIFTT
ncbi:MAG: haloacid dehalogenase [Planctomycetaceae bacterium]|nr:haloacid dehalogenase [Planctomycetaceae bacterium]